MKIMWVSNSPIGPASEILGSSYGGSSGGWIASEYQKINTSENKFVFLCTSREIKKGTILKKDSDIGRVYCLNSPRLCYGIKNPKILIKQVREIINTESPDIIQIWGTETCISNIVSNIETSCPKFVFIQGLLGIHQRYLGGYFSKQDIKDFFIAPTILEKIKEYVRIKGFKKQALIERDTIIKCKNVICDGDIVKAYCSSISDEINIFDYKLIPNKVFYNCKWDYDKCCKFSIFTIYSGNSEKGLHQLLKALCIVKKQYPNVSLRIPGPYSVDDGGILIPNTYYEKNLASFIKHNNLIHNVCFVGKLTPICMANEMLKSNCFVNTSIMEVHALSLREALVCGVPSISTICGSVLNYLTPFVDGYLYRYEEPELLAKYIIEVFESKEKCVKYQGKFLYNDNNLIDVYNEFFEKRNKKI